MKDIWVSISGAIAQQKNVETIANNVANINTPGFKKDKQVFKEYLTALEKGNNLGLPQKEWSPSDFYKSYGAEKSFVAADGTYTNFAQGQINPTGNNLDVAIKGKGFLEVLTPNGIRFTRNGSFTLSGDGILVNSEGFRVLAQDDGQKDVKERFIKIPNGKTFINLQGEIYTSGTKIKNISIVEFENLQQLKKEGNTLYINGDKANISDKNISSVIYQGFIESSNVNALQEMADLIRANRQFESIQRVIKTYDSIAGKGVNEIAKF